MLIEYKTDVLDAELTCHFTSPVNFEPGIPYKTRRNHIPLKLSQANHTEHNHPLTMLKTIVTPLAFAGVTFAIVMPIGYCPQPTTTYTASAAPFYYGPPVLDTDVASCNSTDTTTCALGVSASTSAGYTITIGGGLSLDL